MTDKAYLIKNMLMYQAELGAAVQRKYDHPALDLITQREAFFFLKERDTAYGGEFTHGQAWVKRMTREGKLNPKRRGKSDNSPLMYSKAEMIALWNAEYMEINEIFRGIKL
ncbi:hypothetical protein [Parabacteroides sp.]|jgi:hypothetical protein|uniref:hypothetical protein n=1 Tax=Parabacteroides sp. TaxID=1869337 RepID=UPI001E0E594A|nr:hypothetical protein [Parabacteroides sp.]MBS5485513.1 hypothetical protein [Parabacteroides sp.]DAE61677.1 MAG TPA: hypothetical protein [Caudoviricetes sp.]